MSYAKPIWVQVDACTYKSNKSYGAKQTNEQKIFVGSSSKNSHELVNIVTHKFEDDEGNICFKFKVDGITLKVSKFKNNKGRAGEFIGTKYVKDIVEIKK